MLRGVAEHAITEMGRALTAARLDALPIDRAIAHVTAMFVRTGTEFAALISLDDVHVDPETKNRVLRQPLRRLIARGMKDGTLRGDLPPEVLFEMFSALIVRALSLTAAGTVTPEHATDAVVAVFLDGTRELSSRRQR